MKNNIDLSVVIPCYNEEENIPLIVDRLKKTLPQKLNAELILVDNGSTDNSNKIIKEFSKEYSFVKPTFVKKNLGYGFGVLRGLKKAKGEYLSFTHGDMQTDPYDAIRAYKIMIKQKTPKKCFVKATRMGRPFREKVFEVATSLIESISMRKPLYDVFAVPSLFHRDILKKIIDPPHNHSFDIQFYYLSKKLKYKIIRFPVIFSKRVHGKSHWNNGLGTKWKFLKRMINDSKKIKRVVDKQI